MAKCDDINDPTTIIAQIRQGDLVGVKVFLRARGDPNLRNNMGWTLLHLACLEGQAEIAEALLDAGALVNSCTTDMCTPLHLASAKGSKKTVEILANKGSYINAQDKNGNTPLHEAAKNFHTPIVNFLIDRKGDITRTNKKNQTFLNQVGQQMMAAVESGDSDTLVQWLDWGLNPNTSGNLNWSILHHASARGQINIASILLERGADVNILDCNKSSPLHAAAFHGHNRIVELLLGRGANVNAQDQRGNTALHSAISGGHPVIMNLLLQNGGDTNIANNEGQIFTHLVNEYLVNSVEKCEVAHVVALLKANANPNSKNSAGFPVLCSAAFKGNVLIVDALLGAGADPNLSTEDNLKTPLHYAAAVGNLFVLKFLLDKGASVVREDRNGLTPLHEVAREGAEDVATVLICRGALLNAQDDEGSTPLHIAARWGQTKIVDMLVEKGAAEDIRNKTGMLYSDLALMRAVRTQNAEQVLSGLAWGGNPNTQDCKGWSLLHHAVYKGAKEVVSVLLDAEADVNIKNKHGRTPLFLASYRGDLPIMTLLLNAGADPNIQDLDSRTSLHWAAEEGSIDTVELLLNRGAERDLKSKKGVLFSDLLLKHLYFAVRHNDENKVESLLRAGADQTAELYGTGITPREEAKRRKYYSILKKMVSLAPSKPHPKPSKEEAIALEDIRKLFEEGEVEAESSDASSSHSDDDEEDGESEEDATADSNEDAYWKMQNASVVLNAKELFQDENNAFWEHWTEKPISAKEAFKEQAWWENSSSSSGSSESSEASSSEESETEPIPSFEEIRQKWGTVIPAKEFFRDDECWWRDAVEDLDKPKVISAKEFFKDEVPWWERNSTDEEDEGETIKSSTLENEKPISAKEFFKEKRYWWEQSSSDDEIANNEACEMTKNNREKEEKSEEDEVSVYEDLEESLTDDWETANDSIMSDTSTMYSVSEGDPKIMASELFAEKPWWEDSPKSANSEESSSAEDELSEDQSDGSEATEIGGDSSNTEREKFSLRKRILSSTESDVSTNVILEDDGDEESVENVLELETDDDLLDSGVLGTLDSEQPSKKTKDIIHSENSAQEKGEEITSCNGMKDKNIVGVTLEKGEIVIDGTPLEENERGIKVDTNNSTFNSDGVENSDTDKTEDSIDCKATKELNSEENQIIINDTQTNIHENSLANFDESLNCDSNISDMEKIGVVNVLSPIKEEQKVMINDALFRVVTQSNNLQDGMIKKEELKDIFSVGTRASDSQEGQLDQVPEKPKPDSTLNSITESNSFLIDTEVENKTLRNLNSPINLQVNKDFLLCEYSQNGSNSTPEITNFQNIERSYHEDINHHISDLEVNMESHSNRINDSMNNKTRISNLTVLFNPTKDESKTMEAIKQCKTLPEDDINDEINQSDIGHSFPESENLKENMAQTHSIQLKINNIDPFMIKDHKEKNTKYKEEKLITLKKPVVNKMDACLARLDASLAWLDSKMASDGLSEIGNGKQTKFSPPPSVADTHTHQRLPQMIKNIQPEPCPTAKIDQDAFKIFRLKVRIPKEHKQNPLENYSETDPSNSEGLMKGSCSENALHDKNYDSVSKLVEYDRIGMQKYYSLAKLESVFPQEKEVVSDQRTNNGHSTQLAPSASEDCLKVLRLPLSDSHKSKSFDLLSILTDTHQDIPTSSNSTRMTTPFKLRRHNSAESYSNTHGISDSIKQNLSSCENLPRNRLADAFFHNEPLSRCQTENTTNRRCHSVELPDRTLDTNAKSTVVQVPAQGEDASLYQEIVIGEKENPHKVSDPRNTDSPTLGLQSENACRSKEPVVEERSTNDCHIPENDSKGISCAPVEKTFEQNSHYKVNVEKIYPDVDVSQYTSAESRDQTLFNKNANIDIPSKYSQSNDPIQEPSYNNSMLDNGGICLPICDSLLLPNRSNWRWSTFEPRTLNEYDQIVSSFNSNSNKLNVLLKKSKSTNSVNEISSENETGQGGSVEIVDGGNRTMTKENFQNLYSTDDCESKSNFRMKPPIPPRRPKDNRPLDEKLEEQSVSFKKMANDWHLSNNTGKSPENEGEEYPSGLTHEKGNIADQVTRQKVANATLDETPKPPPRRTSRRGERIVQRSSSCSIC